MKRLALGVCLVVSACADFDRALATYCDDGRCDAGMAGGGSAGGGAAGGGAVGGGASGGGGGAAGGGAAGGGTNDAGVSCTNGVRDGQETDVDCGGTCPDDCGADAGCAAPGDCASGFCHASAKRCALSECTDGTQNGQETDVDCGATCAKCEVGAGCLANGDCVTTRCDAFQRCALFRLEWRYEAPLLCSRGNTIAASVGDQVLVAGPAFNCSGSVNGDPTSVVERLAPDAGGAWAESNVTLGNRFGMVMLPGPRDDAFVVGGFSDSQTAAMAATLRSDLTGPFRGSMPLRQRRAHHAGTTLPDGRLWVAGGHVTDVTNSTVPAEASSELFTALPDGGGFWDAGAPLATARAGARAVTVGNEVWVMGGVEQLNAGPVIASIEIHPLDGGAPRARAPLPAPKAFFGSVLAPDGRIYVVGGMAVDGGTTTEVLAIDPVTGRATDLPPLLEPRRELALVVAPDGRLLSIAGLNPMNGATPQVFAYGPDVRLALTPDGGVSVSGSFFPSVTAVEVRTGSARGPVLTTLTTSVNGSFTNTNPVIALPPSPGTHLFFTDVKSRYPVKARIPR